MPGTKPNGTEGGPSGKAKGTAYLVAVRQRHEAPRVYAVIAPSARAALEQVGALATEDMQVEVVGGLSRDLVRRLGLKPGELRLV
jgi:hypothetical protein